MPKPPATIIRQDLVSEKTWNFGKMIWRNYHFRQVYTNPFWSENSRDYWWKHAYIFVGKVSSFTAKWRRKKLPHFLSNVHICSRKETLSSKVCACKHVNLLTIKSFTFLFQIERIHFWLSWRNRAYSTRRSVKIRWSHALLRL